MAKISEYDDYETGKTLEEVAQFKETGVLPVSGEYETNGDKTTKSVKLKDLLGGGGSSLPSIGSGDTGKVLQVNGNSLQWAFVGDIENVDAGDGLTGGGSAGSVTLSISTAGASDGQVLTYNGTSRKVGWETPSGGGSSWTKATVDVTDQTISSQGYKYIVNIPSNNTLVNVVGLGTNNATYDVEIVPPTVGANEVINCLVEFQPAEKEGNNHIIEVDNMHYCAEDYSSSGSYFSNEYNWYQISLIGSFWRLSMESDE